MRMTYDEMIAVIRAHKEGKTVCFRSKCESAHRGELGDNPAWDFSRFMYWIKPEPREIWVNEDHEGGLYNVAWKSEGEAIRAISHSGKAIKFIEVID